MATASSQKRNLVLVMTRRDYHEKDFQFMRDCLLEEAPDIRPIVIADSRSRGWRPDLLWRPTAVFALTPLRKFRSWRGKVFQGERLTKSQEYTRLEAHGIPVPKWTVVTRTSKPCLDGFGPYVVSKPDLGGRGADVRIQRRGRVKWRMPETDYTAECADLLIQEFVYTGPWPVSYRVASFFGKVLFAYRSEADNQRRRLEGPDQFQCGGISVVATAVGGKCALTDDPEIIALGERTHQAFPDVPLLGVDIIRDVQTGKLYVLEVNANGGTWHFSSRAGVGIQRDNGIDLRAQFDGLRKAARVLAEQTRTFAA